MTTNSAATTFQSARGPADLDNLLRRELKVGDPNDPAQIAQALADRYQANTRAQAIDGEARGLPFLNTPIVRASTVPVQTASDIDLMQARDDVSADLDELLRSNLTKDIRPELEGWQQVIQTSIDDGVAAARFGLDPRKRDTTFAMRRQLSEFALLCRILGACTPALNQSMRNLATSLDEASAVMLVLMGESMANVGFSGGRFLLQVPYAELQARRDAVLTALRRVEGLSAIAGGSDSWPRGLRAYRGLTQLLEANGQGDLRALMNEAELARTLDNLVQLASGGTPRGLRAVGATAWGAHNRVYRFVQSTVRPLAQTSPELATLHESLLLFLDSFGSAGGFRLLRIARPTVLNYGLYGSANVSRAERRLIELVNRRGALARELDNVTQCVCDRATLLSQIVLDKVLHDLDRAIDFYCVGDSDLGVPEVRAASVSHLIDAVLPVDPLHHPAPALGPGGSAPALWAWTPSTSTGGPAIPRPAYLDAVVTSQSPIALELDAIRSLLRPRPANAAPGGRPNAYPQSDWWEAVDTEAAYAAYLHGDRTWPAAELAMPFGLVLQAELSASRQTSLQWRIVIEQMAGTSLRAAEVLESAEPPTAQSGCLPLLLDRAIDYLVTSTVGSAVPVPFDATPPDPDVPQHFEETLEDMADALRNRP